MHDTILNPFFFLKHLKKYHKIKVEFNTFYIPKHKLVYLMQIGCFFLLKLVHGAFDIKAVVITALKMF